MRRTGMRAAALLLAALALAQGASAQTSEELKAGVVKIRASGSVTPRDATGFIIHATEDVVHIVTAAHAVEGASHVEVTFYTRKDVPVPARVDCAQFDNAQGIATLKVVRRKRNGIPGGLVALKLDTAGMMRGGEEVTTICFPGRTGLWSVLTGRVARSDGTGYILKPGFEEGCSGAPLFRGGLVAGVITSEAQLGLAVRSKIVSEALTGWSVPGFENPVGERAAQPPPARGDEEAEIRRVVVESQRAETLDIYVRPKDFDKGLLEKYWVPVSRGGNAILKVEAAVRRLLSRGLRYGEGSHLRRFDIVSVRIEGDVAYVNTVEHWYCVLYRDSGERVWEHDPNLGLSNIEYTLRKIDGRWLIQYNSTPMAR